MIRWCLDIWNFAILRMWIYYLGDVIVVVMVVDVFIVFCWLCCCNDWIHLVNKLVFTFGFYVFTFCGFCILVSSACMLITLDLKKCFVALPIFSLVITERPLSRTWFLLTYSSYSWEASYDTLVLSDRSLTR